MGGTREVEHCAVSTEARPNVVGDPKYLLCGAWRKQNWEKSIMSGFLMWDRMTSRRVASNTFLIEPRRVMGRKFCGREIVFRGLVMFASVHGVRKMRILHRLANEVSYEVDNVIYFGVFAVF